LLLPFLPCGVLCWRWRLGIMLTMQHQVCLAVACLLADSMCLFCHCLLIFPPRLTPSPSPARLPIQPPPHAPPPTHTRFHQVLSAVLALEVGD
jgi:hypothetical protein